MSKTQLQANNARLASLITELQGKAAGGGGGLETCQVTIRQQWGGNDDPAFLYLYIVAYNIIDGECVPYNAVFNSNVDGAAEHSVTLTVYKNIPITFQTFTAGQWGLEKVTVSTTNGTLNQSVEMSLKNIVMWQLTPTGDTSTFVFMSD